MEKRIANVAVLVSGGGTNLQAILDAQQKGIIRNGRVRVVISSQPDAYALDRASKAGIPSAVACRSELGSQEAFEAKIISVLEDYKIDLIVLAGFMSILSADFTGRYPERIINVHPALIPSFCGKGFYGLHVHEAVLRSGVKVTGATVHFVNEVPDGGKIIMQKAVEVRDGDTPNILQRRVMEQAEWIILPEAVEKVSAGIVGAEYQERKNANMNIYELNNIADLLKDNPYPGRGIVTGCSLDGKKAVIAYFIMGRSANSRNRVFTEKNGEVFTEPFDASKVEDPSLIIYAAVRSKDNNLIVTNGNQTDTIYDGLCEGKSFSEALGTREFEPDSPNWTPRISSMLTFADGGFSYQMSILKSVDEAGSACARFTYAYPAVAGLGHFIHTYVTDGNPIPTFQGEPERVLIENNIDKYADKIWNSLNEQNKISLYVRYTDIATGRYEDRIINKNI